MMFPNPLIEVPTIELMKLWGELVEAYHGVHGYGGTVAEIYAYRLQRYSPVGHSEVMSGAPKSRAGQEALSLIEQRSGNALVALIEEFCNEYDCKAKIDGVEPKEWCKRLNFNQLRFDHRVNVEVIR